MALTFSKHCSSLESKLYEQCLLALLVYSPEDDLIKGRKLENKQ